MSAPNTITTFVPITSAAKPTPNGHGSLGALPRSLSSHAATSPAGHQRHSESQSDPNGRQRKSEPARRRSQPLRAAAHHHPNPNSKRESSSAYATVFGPSVIPIEDDCQSEP